MREYLITLLVAAAVTYLATPVVRRFAVRVGAMTGVRDRDVHTIPTPRLGGAAMFAGVAAALLVASRMPTLQVVNQRFSEPRALLLGGGIVFVIGALDDRFNLDAVTKLAGQILAASVMVLQGVQLLWLPIPGSGTLILGQDWSVILTVHVHRRGHQRGQLHRRPRRSGGRRGRDRGARLLRAGLPPVGGVAPALRAAADADRDHRRRRLPGVLAAQLPSGAGLHGRLGSDADRPAARGVDGLVDRAGRRRSTQYQQYGAFLPLLLPFAILLVPFADLVLAVARRAKAGGRRGRPTSSTCTTDCSSSGIRSAGPC